MKQLILVRHGQSAWNLENRFTGWADIDLTPTGVEQSLNAGKLLREAGYEFDIAYTSVLKRAIRTLWHIQDSMDLMWVPVVHSWRLNERHYGGLTGLNKAETAAQFGDEQVHIWRRSYDIPPPGGESLRDTGARVWPYYLTEILPRVLRGEKVLVAARGNSLRSLVMVLDKLTKEQILGVNLATGVPMVYKLKADSTVASKEVLGDMSAAH